ncbi:MAG: hypothetical protein FWC95_06030 [Defluviitaleaceae bacterium]|nr:hypothetical protein [Defluviitaleaceae bacterium]
MKRIVICGSMSAISKMKDVAKQLEIMDYTPILPDEGDIPEGKFNEYKKDVSMKHFNAISHESTYAVLIVNEAKRGIDNYIGANSFAEIALAFYFGKKIFLLNDIYTPYADELAAWGAVTLNNDLQRLPCLT